MTPARPAGCICDSWCYRGEDGTNKRCPYCTSQLDIVYDPCPVNGFGCGASGGEPCDCCTPAQWAAAGATP